MKIGHIPTLFLYISSSLDKEEISGIFGEAFPSKISEIMKDDKIFEQITDIKDGCKLYCLWWD